MRLPDAVGTRAAAAALGIGFVALFWSVVASTVFLAGSRLLTPTTLPLHQFWDYVRYYGFGHAVVGTWLKIAAAVPTILVLSLAVARVARQGLSGLSRRPLHGETRWASAADMRAVGLRAGFGGLYVGKDGRGRHLRFGGTEHVACYAPTRSGKGVGLVIPNCLLYEASLVCLDVKKENWAASAGIRAEAGQQVFLFDPLAADGRTARYNPFSYVRRGTLDAFEDLQRIAQMVFPHAEGDQQFWTDSARSAFVGTAGFLAETPGQPLTMGQVLRLLSGNEGANSMLRAIEARRQAGNPYTEATVRALEDYVLGSPDLVNSIRKTVTARLSLWFNPRIDAATAESDFDLRRLRHGLHALYIGVAPDNLARLRPLLALFFQQLVDILIRQLPQHDPLARHQVLMLLDEFPLLGPMPILADAFAHIAGYDVRLMLVMQSKAQLRDRALYGPDGAAAILDNCGLEVVFGTKDLALTEELSARLGYGTVDSFSRSGPRFWRAFQSSRDSMTLSDQRRALLLPQEVARLRANEAILVRPGSYPVRCQRIRYFEDRLFRHLTRPAPLVPPIEVAVRLDQGRPSRAALVATQDEMPTSADTAAAPDIATASKIYGNPALTPRSARATPMAARPDRAAASPRSLEAPVDEDGALCDHSSEDSTAARSMEMQPYQADGLIASILGSDVDMTPYGLEDGKALIGTLLAALPSAGSLSVGKRRSA